MYLCILLLCGVVSILESSSLASFVILFPLMALHYESFKKEPHNVAWTMHNPSLQSTSRSEREPKMLKHYSLPSHSVNLLKFLNSSRTCSFHKPREFWPFGPYYLHPNKFFQSVRKGYRWMFWTREEKQVEREIFLDEEMKTHLNHACRFEKGNWC